MSSDDAFLQAIQLHPEDDAPRLVYADWLEEHGNEARAELIRLQCAHCDLPRQQELLARFSHNWAGPIFRQVYSFTFRRGFVDEVTISGRTLVALGPRLLHAAPIRLLRIIGAYEVLDGITQIAELAQLRALHLTRCKIGDEGVSLLTRCAYLSRLQVLRLGENSVSDEGIESIVDSPYLTNLMALSLHHNQVGDLGASLLAKAPHGFSELRILDLSENRIGEVGAEALARAPGSLQLHYLDLSNQFKCWTDEFELRDRPNPIQPPQRFALQKRFGSTVCVF